MPNILIIGATGTIGYALAQSLRLAGTWNIYGLARTASKAQSLAAEEIIPVLCPDPINDDAHTWQDVVRHRRVDVIVDAMAANEGSLKILEAAKAISRERLAAAEREGCATPQKLGFVYTSGMWVHGHSTAQISDLTPVGSASAPTPAVELIKHRTGWEQVVLKANDALDVAIVRPAMVYGKNSWIFDCMWTPILEAKGAEKVEVPVTEDALVGLVHVDDLAEGMRGLIERLPLFAASSVYPVFDLGTSMESLADLARGAAKALGYGGQVEMVGPGANAFYKAVNTTVNIDAGRAMQLLGWVPRKLAMLPKVDMYATAWKASKEGK